MKSSTFFHMKIGTRNVTSIIGSSGFWALGSGFRVPGSGRKWKKRKVGRQKKSRHRDRIYQHINTHTLSHIHSLTLTLSLASKYLSAPLFLASHFPPTPPTHTHKTISNSSASKSGLVYPLFSL